MYGVPRERLALCPNGFDAAELAPVLAERRRRRPGSGAGQRPRLLFTGSAHGPNVEAARFLLRIALALPEMDLVLAGGVCGPLAEAAGIPPNVTLAGPFDEPRKHALYAEADLYLNPVVEGSGTNLKTVEALAAGLPLIATPEAVRGVPVRAGREAVLAERSGFVEAIRAAAGMAPEALARMAEAGEALVRGSLDWAAIADALAARILPLAAGGATEGPGGAPPPPPPLALAFNDYPLDGATFGGARRIREVLGHLGMDVALLCLGGRPGVSLVAPGFLHVTLPKEERHREVERAVNAAFPAVSATDVVAGLFCAANRGLVALAAEIGRRCSAVVFEHCYMAPMLDAAFPEGGATPPPPPVVYSAHNVEAPLKARLLEGHPLRAELVDFTARIEAALTRRADLVVACSAADAAHFAAAGARTLLVPNGCDPDAAAAGEADPPPGAAGRPDEGGPPPPPPRVGFMGSAHPPNVEAARFILDTLAPALPELRFEFLGGVCHALGQPAAENVTLHWTVDEATKSRLRGGRRAALGAVLGRDAPRRQRLRRARARRLPAGAGLRLRDGDRRPHPAPPGELRPGAHPGAGGRAADRPEAAPLRHHRPARRPATAQRSGGRCNNRARGAAPRLWPAEPRRGAGRCPGSDPSAARGEEGPGSGATAAREERARIRSGRRAREEDVERTTARRAPERSDHPWASTPAASTSRAARRRSSPSFPTSATCRPSSPACAPRGCSAPAGWWWRARITGGAIESRAGSAPIATRLQWSGASMRAPPRPRANGATPAACASCR